MESTKTGTAPRPGPGARGLDTEPTHILTTSRKADGLLPSLYWHKSFRGLPELVQGHTANSHNPGHTSPQLRTRALPRAPTPRPRRPPHTSPLAPSPAATRAARSRLPAEAPPGPSPTRARDAWGCCRLALAGRALDPRLTPPLPGLCRPPPAPARKGMGQASSSPSLPSLS